MGVDNTELMSQVNRLSDAIDNDILNTYLEGNFPQSIEFRLPLPPSLNRYYRVFRGRWLVSKVGREYKEKVKELINKNGLDYGIDCRLKVSLEIAPSRSGEWDIDNRLKALFDSLTEAGFWIDDKLVDELSIKKLPKYAMGEVYMTVEEII